MILDRAFGIILVNDGKVLMTCRPGADGWDFPKGHVHDDESDWLGACRELEEETGITIVIHDKGNQMFHTSYFFIKEGESYFKQCYFWLVKDAKLDTVPTNHDDSDMEQGMTSEFVPIEEVESRIKFEPIKRLWKEVIPHVLVVQEI